MLTLSNTLTMQCKTSIGIMWDLSGKHLFLLYRVRLKNRAASSDMPVNFPKWGLQNGGNVELVTWISPVSCRNDTYQNLQFWSCGIHCPQFQASSFDVSQEAEYYLADVQIQLHMACPPRQLAMSFPKRLPSHCKEREANKKCLLCFDQAMKSGPAEGADTLRSHTWEDRLYCLID